MIAMGTINATTDSVSAVVHACMGGKFRVRLEDPKAKPGSRWGDVLDDNGVRIGDASDYIYGGRGFAIHTRPFGGFVSEEQIEFVR